MIKYIPRYSRTDEPDEQGRWARVAYFKDIQIAWISLTQFTDTEGNQQKEYLVQCHFPTLPNDTANNYHSAQTVDEAKGWLEKEWKRFLKIVNN